MSRFVPISRRRQAVKRTLSTLALAVAAVACFAPVAGAKTYKVYACKTPGGTPIPLDRSQWTSIIERNYSTAAEGCAAGNPISLYMGTSPAVENYRPGRAATWRLDAPVPISGAKVWRSVSTRSMAGDQGATPLYEAALSYNRGGLETCLANGCQIGSHGAGDASQNEVTWPFPANTYSFELFVHCGGGPGDTFCVNGGGERVTAAFHRFEFNAEDSDVPRVVANTVTGSLLDTGEQDGTRTIKLRAQDWGSGLYQVAATLDGKEIGSLHPLNNGSCARVGSSGTPDYRHFQPCTTDEVEANFSIDSTKYSDGRHTLKVWLEDAAGNVTTVRDDVIKLANAPRNVTRPSITTQVPGNDAAEVKDPRPKDTLTASPGSWSGVGVQFAYQWERSDDGVAWTAVANAANPGYTVANEDVDKYLRVVVTATNTGGKASLESAPTVKVRTGETIDTKDVPGAPTPPDNGGGGGDVNTAQLVVDREQRTVEVRHGAKIVITGRLVDANSQPIADAEVDVFEQLALTAAPWQKIGTVKTDSQGGYVFRPKTTASRRLRFAFADRRDAANYRATREVLVSVQAGMSISAKRRNLRAGDTIRLRGHVTIDNLPETGTWVEVQVLDAGVWRTVATRRTSSKGLWTFKHRLRQSAGVTFRFRSRLRVVGDVPSAEAKSAPVKIRIR